MSLCQDKYSLLRVNTEAIYNKTILLSTIILQVCREIQDMVQTIPYISFL
uniref:Uncharacterized protein n=1 Tax=Anguilla anguilla TaxID=7936 RepID=A0A0E9WFJ4_ANGAN